MPCIIAHGSEDTLVDVKHARIIHEAYAGDKQLVILEGEGHNTMRSEFFDTSCTIFLINYLSQGQFMNGAPPNPNSPNNPSSRASVPPVVPEADAKVDLDHLDHLDQARISFSNNNNNNTESSRQSPLLPINPSPAQLPPSSHLTSASSQASKLVTPVLAEIDQKSALENIESHNQPDSSDNPILNHIHNSNKRNSVEFELPKNPPPPLPSQISRVNNVHVTPVDQVAVGVAPTTTTGTTTIAAVTSPSEVAPLQSVPTVPSTTKIVSLQEQYEIDMEKVLKLSIEDQ